MQVSLGATVRTADGENVGSIDKLILDPHSHDVKTAVVRKGFILTEDVEIPLDALDSVSEDEVRLHLSADEVRSLPRFSEANYTAPPPSYAMPAGYTYPSDRLLWPLAVPAYPMAFPPYWTPPPGPEGEVRDMLRQQDLENVVIDEGSDVYSSDEHKIGEVHKVIFDSASGRPSRILVRRGFLFTEDFELPASLIASLDDGVIHLNQTRDAISGGARSTV
jgi:uncharacterized protein YrrD